MSTAPSDAPDTQASVNILIVDDEPRNLTVLESVLADPDYRLVRATSGEEALLALMKEDFAVLVLDVRMPGMTGFELAEIIKGRKKTASIPIIFLTAFYNDDQHVLEGYGSGAVDYLHKPVNTAVLRSKVAVFAELHRKSRELRQLNASLDQRVAERTAALAESEAKLRHADAMKDEFLATLAHELRNPLAPIRNAVHVVKAAGPQGSQLPWACDIIERQVRTMSRLIDDLMDVSRINRGHFELRREVFDLHAAVTDAVETVQPLLLDCGHQLEVTQDPQPLPVDADRARIAQALVNLLANAAKYTDSGGRIELHVERHAGQVVLRVKDTGIGIAPERLASVFEMFAQEDVALARSRGGLGIGLALTRKLVLMHGGEIGATSDGPGLGSEFSIKLPLSAATQAAQEPAAEEAAAAPAGLRILVADDNRDAAETLGTLLELMGHAVMRVHDGESAVAAVQSFDPQLVLLDIGMPRLNGYEACQRIRTAAGGSARKLAAVTGWGQAQDLARSQEAGFDSHLVKPIGVDALSQLIASTVAPRPN
ncbi:response regulator [Ramlibacter sp. G-1-2-2]|uniref:histidine kinase n=1 Tax=Ramlibacter agri TaxID=2728837 RepID=A0A848H1F6_9BURK|nr:response regulator [Ramlibacter agri]NML44394.1 response regulator [Ramlibacter agri]